MTQQSGQVMEMIGFAVQYTLFPSQPRANEDQTHFQDFQDNFCDLWRTRHGVYLTGSWRMVNPDATTTEPTMRTSTVSPRSAAALTA